MGGAKEVGNGAAGGGVGEGRGDANKEVMDCVLIFNCVPDTIIGICYLNTHHRSAAHLLPCIFFFFFLTFFFLLRYDLKDFNFS